MLNLYSQYSSFIVHIHHVSLENIKDYNASVMLFVQRYNIYIFDLQLYIK